MKKSSVSVLLFFVVLLTSHKPVYADCAITSSNKAYKNSDVIVVGTAVKETAFQPIQRPEEYNLGMLIKPEKVLKGKVPKKLVVTGAGMEGIQIHKGKSYLLYLTKSDNHYKTKECYPDHELTEKEKEKINLFIQKSKIEWMSPLPLKTMFSLVCEFVFLIVMIVGVVTIFKKTKEKIKRT